LKRKKNNTTTVFELEETRNEAVNVDSPYDRLSNSFEESAIQSVNALIYDGVKKDASDIHLEPRENNLLVRLRIDGALRDYPPFPQEIMSQIISRVKLLAGMDIAERRLPQDGSMYLEIEGNMIHIRASTLPIIHGEKIVLRLLSPEKVIRPIEELGFSPMNLQRYYHFLDSSHGMILVAGPTGCGKTTTLYSTLQYLNKREKNIVSVENPVEYRLEGINQVQVNTKIGLTFASTLRTVLRQDPDIIMVGEIRDSETAEIVTRAGLTGQMVFSTLHTGDAARSITRLLDMGVQSFLLTSSLVGIISQRLVRIICPHCRQAYSPTKDEYNLLSKLHFEQKPDCLYRGSGCENCSGTGFKGRTAIHEVMAVDTELRNLIKNAVNTTELKAKAISQGMTPLIHDGIEKCKMGLTTLDEVVRVAYSTL